MQKHVNYLINNFILIIYQNNILIVVVVLIVQSCSTLWTIACQGLLSMGFSRQEYWSGLPLLSSWDIKEKSYIQCCKINGKSYFHLSPTNEYEPLWNGCCVCCPDPPLRIKVLIPAADGRICWWLTTESLSRNCPQVQEAYLPWFHSHLHSYL